MVQKNSASAVTRLASARRLRFAMLSAAAMLGIANVQAETRALTLFQMFNDSGRTSPRSHEPYRITLDGAFSEAGVTGSTGEVLTHRREPGTQQEFVAQIFRFGTYSFVVSKDEQVAARKIGAWDFSDSWRKNCDPEKTDSCKGKGFYWIKLLGRETSFEAEPYTLTAGGRTVDGVVSDDGNIFLPWSNPLPISDPMTLRLCDGPALKVVSGVSEENSVVTQLKDSEAPVPSKAKCVESKLGQFVRTNQSLNGGMPYLFSAWSQGMSPPEIQVQAERDAAKELGSYERAAADNTDLLAWLGRLPSPWSDAIYGQRMSAIVEKIQKDIASLRPGDLNAFKCKTPSQVGAVPDLKAVDDYLLGLPESAWNMKLRNGLHAAAAKGNWLAVAQVYVLESQSPSSKDPRIHAFRTLQLMEWLQARKIGTLYREFESALQASGYYSDLPGSNVTSGDVYAALHHSYPAQFEVGAQALRGNEDDADLRAIGQRMQACARAALPGYRAQLQ